MNVFEGALEVLDERGWTQRYLEDPEGRVCLVGALSVAAFGNPQAWLSTDREDRLTFGYLLVTLERLTNSLTTVSFNEDPHTTEEDVRLVLKRAAAGER